MPLLPKSMSSSSALPIEAPSARVGLDEVGDVVLSVGEALDGSTLNAPEPARMLSQIGLLNVQ